MTKKDIRCKVLGHSDGPSCEDCGEAMDTVRVETKDHPLTGKEAHYCFPCTEKLKQ